MVDSVKISSFSILPFVLPAYRMCTDFGTWKIEKQKHSQISTGRRDSETVVLNWGDFAGRLVMPGDIFGHHNWAEDATGTHRGCQETGMLPTSKQGPATPTAKNGLAPNVSSAKTEKLCLRGPLTQPPTKLGNLSLISLTDGLPGF